MKFLPNEKEQKLIKIIQKHNRNEFALIRLTHTMLIKSTIDASEEIKNIIEKDCGLKYDSMPRGEKFYKKSKIISKFNIQEKKTSFYHPNAKNDKSHGDPRFWIYDFKKIASENELFYFSSYQNQLIAIQLIEHDNFENFLQETFPIIDNKENELINELLSKVAQIKSNNWIESIAPNRIIKGKLQSANKDAGETFEHLLDINPNNSSFADYKNFIELKTKRIKSNNNDTLFCKVPNWNISPIKSAKEMYLKFGYPSNNPKYQGYKDLYVTVDNKPNNQGLFLYADSENKLLQQLYKDKNNKNSITANWEYSVLKETLYNKHKTTLWVSVEEKKENNKIYFRYISAQLSKKPIFSQFILLINLGVIKFDWRGRVKCNGKNPKDKGHAFRINNSKRNLLFEEIEIIDFSKIKS